MGCVAQQHPAIDIALAVADPDALSGGRGLTSRRDSTIDWCASGWIGIRCLPSAVSGVVFLALAACFRSTATVNVALRWFVDEKPPGSGQAT